MFITEILKNMSRKSGQFLHPQDVVCTQSQGGTQSKKYYSSVYLTPDKSVMDDLDTSSSSLFGSEDMEHAFRDYCSQFVSGLSDLHT